MDKDECQTTWCGTCIGDSDIKYGVCGCAACGIGIYNGVIVWVKEDGTKVNRFRGEGSHREQWVDHFIAQQLTPED